MVFLGFLLLPGQVRPQELPAQRYAGEIYLLRGTVRDASTGAPVWGARIWPYRKGWGVVSDSQGNYQLTWEGHGIETFIVRLCDEHNVAAEHVEFADDSIVRRDISVTMREHRACTTDERPPWAVDARDTVRFTGHYFYSWEGGGWLESCDGKTYWPDWDSVLAGKLKRWRQGGPPAFLRFQGRTVFDRLGKNIDSGLVWLDRPIYLVSKVQEVRTARAGDCR